MLSVNLLLNPRQLPVFRLALFRKGNVNAAIMIQLSRPNPASLPFSWSFQIPGIPHQEFGNPTKKNKKKILQIAVINPYPGRLEAQGLLLQNRPKIPQNCFFSPPHRCAVEIWVKISPPQVRVIV